MSIRLLLAALLALHDVCAFAQSAEQQIVSVVDSPDPVVPGQNITYTVTMRNNGPGAAVNGGLNVNIGSHLALISRTAPAGYTCATFGASLSCTTPNFNAGSEPVFTIVVGVDASRLNSPDGVVSSTFFTSGLTADPVPGNNQIVATTAYDSPQIDLAISASDAPDPVGPNQTITYQVVATSLGPDTAQNVNINIVNNGNLRFQSATTPAGFTCVFPAVGGTPIFNCSAPVFAPGSVAFQVVLRADVAVLGINDTTVQVAFGINGTGNDTNHANEDVTVFTAYVTPDADLSISVDDMHDPTFIGDSIQYLIAVANAGPDAAPDMTVNVVNNGTLRFESMEAPAGYNCTLPAVGATPVLSCTRGEFASGASDELILTLRSDPALISINGGDVQVGFGANSSIGDPVNANNSETEVTTLVSDRLFSDGFED